MKTTTNIIISLVLIIQLAITPAFAEDSKNELCQTTEPISKIQDKEIKNIMHVAQCNQSNHDAVLSEMMGSCLLELAKGTFDFLVAQIEGLWELIEISYDIANRFGTFITGYLSAAWNGTEALFWAEQYHQGASFFTNVAKTLQSIPQIIMDFYDKESNKFRCMNQKEKIDYICHATGRVGPEIALVALGIWKGPPLAEMIIPKLAKVTKIEKIQDMSRAIEIKKISKAKAASEALEAKELAKTIKYHPRPIDSHEFKEIGEVLKNPKQIENLEDGAYLYVIDSKGNAAISERFPDLTGKSKEVLATHPAVQEKLAKSVGRNEVASAGEFYVDAGQIAEVNNKSGRFHGSAEHLDFATKILKGKGLEIRPGTKIRDFDALERDINNKIAFRDPEHFSEKRIAEVITNRFGNNPEMVQEFNNFKKAYKGIYKNEAWRGNEIGKINEDKLIDEAMAFMDKYPDRTDEATVAFYYAANATKDSSRHFKSYIGITNGSFSPEVRKKALDLMEHMASTGHIE